MGSFFRWMNYSPFCRSLISCILINITSNKSWGFADGRAGMHYLLPWFHLSDALRRCIRRTTTDCYPYRSFLLGCRFGRSGSSGFVGVFHLLHWSGCVPVPKVRSCRNRCRYRYICRPIWLLAVCGCRPKRSEYVFRGRLKLSEKQKPRACRTHPTSGLKVLCGLWLAVNLIIKGRLKTLCWIQCFI